MGSASSVARQDFAPRKNQGVGISADVNIDKMTTVPSSSIQKSFILEESKLVSTSNRRTIDGFVEELNAGACRTSTNC
jgi:hypothetical protein